MRKVKKRVTNAMSQTVLPADQSLPNEDIMMNDDDNKSVVASSRSRSNTGNNNTSSLAAAAAEEEEEEMEKDGEEDAVESNAVDSHSIASSHTSRRSFKITENQSEVYFTKVIILKNIYISNFFLFFKLNYYFCIDCK